MPCNMNGMLKKTTTGSNQPCHTASCMNSSPTTPTPTISVDVEAREGITIAFTETRLG